MVERNAAGASRKVSRKEIIIYEKSVVQKVQFSTFYIFIVCRPNGQGIPLSRENSSGFDSRTHCEFVTNSKKAGRCDLSMGMFGNALKTGCRQLVMNIHKICRMKWGCSSEEERSPVTRKVEISKFSSPAICLGIRSTSGKLSLTRRVQSCELITVTKQFTQM